MDSQSNPSSKKSSPKTTINGTLTQTASLDLKTAKSTVKSEITRLLAKNGNTNSEDQLFPEICLILQVLTNQMREFSRLTSENPQHFANLGCFYISILTNHSATILNFQKFGSYVLFKDSRILDFQQGLDAYLHFIITQLAAFLTHQDFKFLERLLIYFFLLSQHSTVCKASFYKLYIDMQQTLDCQIYKTLLKICEICRLPRLKSDLLALNAKLNVLKRVTSNFPQKSKFSDFGDHRQAKCHEFPLSNLVFKIPKESEPQIPNYDLHSTLNICANRNARNNISQILFKSKTNRFLLTDIQRIEIQNSQNLIHKNTLFANALFELLGQTLETNLDHLESSNIGSGLVYQDSLREVYFQLRIILTILGNSDKAHLQDVEISHFLGVLDALGASFEDFDNGLCFLRLLPLSIPILKNSDLKGSFKQIIEETIIEALQNENISRNPLFVYQSLSVFVHLLKNKLIPKPSKEFRKYLKHHQKVYLEIVKPSHTTNDIQREGTILRNPKLTLNGIVLQLKTVFGELKQFEETQ